MISFIFICQKDKNNLTSCATKYKNIKFMIIDEITMFQPCMNNFGC